jgi:hypothetical protein
MQTPFFFSKEMKKAKAYILMITLHLSSTDRLIYLWQLLHSNTVSFTTNLGKSPSG